MRAVGEPKQLLNSFLAYLKYVELYGESNN